MKKNEELKNNLINLQKKSLDYYRTLFDLSLESHHKIIWILLFFQMTFGVLGLLNELFFSLAFGVFISIMTILIMRYFFFMKPWDKELKIFISGVKE